MRKRTIIFLVLLTLLLAGAAVYGYLVLFRNAGHPVSSNNTYKAVPVDAVLVQHFSQLSTLTGEVLSPGSYMERLFHPVAGTQALLEELNSYITLHNPALLKAEALCSLHPSAKNSLATLFCVSGSLSQDTQWWENFFAGLSIPYIKLSYDGQTMYQVGGEGTGNAVYASYVQDLLMISSSRVVLESSLRHLARGTSLADDPGFARIVEQTQVSKPTRLFIPHQRVPALFAAYLGVPMQKYAAFVRTSAQWTVLDGFIGGHEVRVDGYSVFPSGAEHYFSTLLGQEPQKLMAPQILPAATVAGFSLGLSDPASFLDAYGRYLEWHKIKRNEPEKERIEWFNLLYPTEVSLSCVPYGSELHWITVIHSRYIHQARIQFALLNKQEEGKVMKNPLPGLMPGIFGPIFNLCQAGYYCFIGSFILFGPENLLNGMLEGNLAGNYHSLADAISQTPASPGIMNASNLTLFLQPATGLEQLKTLIDKRYTERLDAWSRYNAQVTFLQFSSLEDRLYAHLSVYGDSLEISPLVPRHKEVRMQDGTRQDTLARGTPPYKVFNHLTRKGNELFQTPWPECRLIMRDHTGKTLWEKTMEGPIQDRVAQLDFLKNDKLQMLFSIGNRLYLLDRLGRNVSPYPRAYAASILYGPFVFDPEGKKEYRILLVHQDNVLRCYDKSGSVSGGWNDFSLSGYLTGQPRYVMWENTGLWVIYTETQTVFLSERGLVRGMTTRKECLDPQAEIRISGPYELYGTTIEGKPITIILESIE
ncbi:MAG: hypothetical protein KBC07_00840 [Bacteroidales bacterium]|nr:hypothetical protein [Bacteroidales bacterium]NLH23279.1 hypothetical protein [Bacteroidales bacterium]